MLRPVNFSILQRHFWGILLPAGPQPAAPAPRASMSATTLHANDPALLISGVYHAAIDSQRATFSRCYDDRWRCGTRNAQNGDEPLYAPGARVAVLTDATRVYATLEFGGVAGYCSPDCTGTPPAQCYRPGGGAVCTNRCEARLYVDGVATPLPRQHGAGGRFSGEQVLLLLDDSAGGGDVGGGPPTGVRTAGSALRKIELVMPWGGVVAFRSFTLSPDTARRQRPTLPTTTVAFYGDSITQGFCADVPYPEAIGQWNGTRRAGVAKEGVVRPWPHASVHVDDVSSACARGRLLGACCGLVAPPVHAQARTSTHKHAQARTRTHTHAHARTSTHKHAQAPSARRHAPRTHRRVGDDQPWHRRHARGRRHAPRRGDRCHWSRPSLSVHRHE